MKELLEQWKAFKRLPQQPMLRTDIGEFLEWLSKQPLQDNGTVEKCTKCTFPGAGHIQHDFDCHRKEERNALEMAAIIMKDITPLSWDVSMFDGMAPNVADALEHILTKQAEIIRAVNTLKNRNEKQH